LIFAKDDSHAEDIVHIIREEFGKGNEFCKKITYKTTGEKPEDLITSFRNSYNPRIVVTVDMISTGTDIKPLECLVFMRDVKSMVYFEQMKGRGTRTISPTDLKSVTPDVDHKTRFVIVDAVGVCENDKTDSRPLERKQSVSFDKLIMAVAMGDRSEDALSSLAGRLARLDKEITEKEHKEINDAGEGRGLKEIIHGLLDAIDPDKRLDKARAMFQAGEPTVEQFKKASEELAKLACAPFDAPAFRDIIIDIKRRNEQVIDTVSQDKVIFAGFDERAREKAQNVINTFRRFIEENKDELTALQLIYGKPYSRRYVTYEEISNLAEAIQKPPYHLTPEVIWQAYEQLDRAKVKGAGPQRLLTNIISLVRFVIGESDILEPFPAVVNRRFTAWLEEQKSAGRIFNQEQMQWLRMIKEHIATSAGISIDDLGLTPFHEKGGAIKADKLFNHQLDKLLEELNEALVA